MKRIAVLASGRGSNFQAILDALARGEINGKCVALITDNKDALDTIFSSKLGDPLNWNCFDGLATDSYAVETFGNLFIPKGWMVK